VIRFGLVLIPLLIGLILALVWQQGGLLNPVVS
jgi:hypothetical protein